MCRPVERFSVWVHGRLWPNLPVMSICAHAWRYREHLCWRLWILVADWIVARAPRWREVNHCRASYERCFPDRVSSQDDTKSAGISA